MHCDSARLTRHRNERVDYIIKTRGARACQKALYDDCDATIVAGAAIGSSRHAKSTASDIIDKDAWLLVGGRDTPNEMVEVIAC